MDNTTKIILTIFIIFGLMIAVFVAFNNMKEKFTNTNFKVRICLFYATWCHHCTKYMESGVFDNVANATKQISNDIKFEEIDYEKNKDLANEYDIGGFPTIIAVDMKGNLINTYSGDRYDSKKLQDFALSSLQMV